MAAAPIRTAPGLRHPIAAAAATLVLCVVLAAPGRAQVVPEPVQQPATGPATADDMRSLDQQVQTVLAEARRQQEQIAQQRERLSRAEAANLWLPWLGMAVLGLGGLSGWLGWRLWRLQRQQVQPPAAPAAAAPVDDPAALNMAALVAAAMPDSFSSRGTERPLLSTPAAGIAPPDMTVAQARRVPLQRDSSGASLAGSSEFSLGTGVPPRPVTVEELLDLDQQVDFFLALGQAQSAIDLLLGHVRGSGGASALPYFRLLEIYRQQGDEEAYERTRERFNQRFNAYAPDWSGDLAGGRLLEDYPDVLRRLQRAWPQPIRAVAEMEGLLLRRADLEPFDLPAYRDLLMLHALVRDMPATPAVPEARALPTVPAAAPPRRAAPPITTPAVLNLGDAVSPPDGESVDLLLPLDDDPLDITAPRPHLAEQANAQAMLADWVFTRAAQARRGHAESPRAQPAAPVRRGITLDLDLSEHAPAPREFTRPAAFTDIDMRRDKRLSDLGGLDEIDSDPTPLPSRR
ncbi:hypothetical protein [Pseudaquabacterium pictum]|uniref:hypothetical protein n=1 Tax=Pseudaquabacterium pictum TaxID=2315236 RepID=UPI0010F99B75|nr:hypothetical protein [Rubrivivax pictus]